MKNTEFWVVLIVLAAVVTVILGFTQCTMQYNSERNLIELRTEQMKAGIR